MAKRKPMGGQLGLGFGITPKKKNKGTSSLTNPASSAGKRKRTPGLVQVRGYCASTYTRKHPKPYKRKKAKMPAALKVYKNQLGQVPDSEIAQLSNLSAQTVGKWRRKEGKPAFKAPKKTRPKKRKL